MKNAIILHGAPPEDEYYDPTAPAASNFHWIPWLQKQLTIHDIPTQTPEMPRAYAPDYQSWQRCFEQFYCDRDSILVGHSCGAGFLVRYLSENPIKIAQLILVAPWLNPDHSYDSDIFDFDIDPLAFQEIHQINLLVSEDDDRDIQQSAQIIINAIDHLHLHQFTDKGHFTPDKMPAAFPELLQLILPH